MHAHIDFIFGPLILNEVSKSITNSVSLIISIVGTSAALTVISERNSPTLVARRNRLSTQYVTKLVVSIFNRQVRVQVFSSIYYSNLKTECV
jgi:hypothetical protein